MEPRIKAGATVAMIASSGLKTAVTVAMIVPSGLKTGAIVAKICRRNVHCNGTRHSSSVAHTAEDD